jgi:hypothetical protein
MHIKLLLSRYYHSKSLSEEITIMLMKNSLHSGKDLFHFDFLIYSSSAGAPHFPNLV